MLRDGNPDPELLREDKYHLSNNGISQLSANLKRAILCIEYPVTY